MGQGTNQCFCFFLLACPQIEEQQVKRGCALCFCADIGAIQNTQGNGDCFLCGGGIVMLMCQGFAKRHKQATVIRINLQSEFLHMI